MQLKEKSGIEDGGMMDLRVEVMDISGTKLTVWDGQMFKDKQIMDKVEVKRPHAMTDFEIGKTYNMKVVINTYDAHGKTCRGMTLDSFSIATKEEVKEAIKEAEPMSKDEWNAKERREYLDKAINTLLSRPMADLDREALFSWAKDKVDGLFSNDAEVKRDLDQKEADNEDAVNNPPDREE